MTNITRQNYSSMNIIDLYSLYIVINFQNENNQDSLKVREKEK